MIGCSNDGETTSATSTSAAGPGGESDTNRGSRGTVSTTSPTSTEPQACVLSPELTAGPYHLDGHLMRSDITEDRPGTPVEFRVKVLALPECEPLAGAAVDIWHCDAGGEYSGFNGNSLEATQTQGTNEYTFLRGVQLTGDDGVAVFKTIFPGWYEGRAVHIHLKVLEGGTSAKTYNGGHVAHVGQAFFDEPLTAQLLKAEPYSDHTGSRTTNDDDSIYRQAGTSAITKMTASEDGKYVGEFTVMVDPTATPEPAPLF